jgi:hypothetical protein
MKAASISRSTVIALLIIVLLLPIISTQAAAPFAECFSTNAFEDTWWAYNYVGTEIDPESETRLSADNVAFWFDLEAEPLEWLGDGSDIPEGKEHVFGVNYGYRGMPGEAYRVGLLTSENAAVWVFVEPNNSDDLWIVLYTPDGPCGAYYVNLLAIEDGSQQGARQKAGDQSTF